MHLRRANGYSFVKRLGKGSFGVVYLVENQDRQPFALKNIQDTQQNLKEAEKQVKMYATLNHPNIVKLHNSFFYQHEGEPCLAIVLEYCPDNDLSECMKSIGQQNGITKCIDIMKQIAQGLVYLHDKKIAHRDIKPENILISNGVYKIADFGSSKILETGRSMTNAGTLVYKAPEVIQKNTYNCKADVWSFGIMSLELILSKRIFKIVQGVPSLKEDFPSEKLFSQIIDKNLRVVVQMMLRKEPKERSTSRQILDILCAHEMLYSQFVYQEEIKKDVKINKNQLKTEAQVLKYSQPIQIQKIPMQKSAGENKQPNLKPQLSSMYQNSPLGQYQNHNPPLNSQELPPPQSNYRPQGKIEFQERQRQGIHSEMSDEQIMQAMRKQQLWLKQRQGTRSGMSNEQKMLAMRIQQRIRQQYQARERTQRQRQSKFERYQQIIRKFQQERNLEERYGRKYQPPPYQAPHQPQLPQYPSNVPLQPDERKPVTNQTLLNQSLSKKINFEQISPESGPPSQQSNENSAMKRCDKCMKTNILKQLQFCYDCLQKYGNPEDIYQGAKLNTVKESSFIHLLKTKQFFPHLKTIDLYCNETTDKGLKALVENGHKFPSLQWIYLSVNKITDEGLKALVENGHKFPSLQWIYLSVNKITDKGLKALVENGHKFPSLKSISLNSNKITDEGLKALVENGHKLPSLQSISLSDNQITGEGLKALVENGHKFPIMVEINLENNQITDKSLQRLEEVADKFKYGGTQIFGLSITKDRTKLHVIKGKNAPSKTFLVKI